MDSFEEKVCKSLVESWVEMLKQASSCPDPFSFLGRFRLAR
jgi:hypothetical protein